MFKEPTFPIGDQRSADASLGARVKLAQVSARCASGAVTLGPSANASSHARPTSSTVEDARRRLCCTASFFLLGVADSRCALATSLGSYTLFELFRVGCGLRPLSVGGGGCAGHAVVVSTAVSVVFLPLYTTS
ncbi:hypothetical protein EVAR_78047_1 [Eumeta japonica]|uniref:Uncharacterized protein n=1 Tax=Eumeta variegata TaxID=151549 RepID=A0A4C1T097_EUMVA|nr:hypothetical protein EVAR_78047_1 [Eumeta japonica]